MNDTLYVSDLDGTLMRNNEKLSEYTIKTDKDFKRTSKAGSAIHFCYREIDRECQGHHGRTGDKTSRNNQKRCSAGR